MENLRCYKQMPVWTKATLPQMFQEKHNTKEGTWAKIEILSGSLKYFELTEAGEVVSETVFDVQHQPPFVAPQVWHKVEAVSDDLACQLGFYCTPQDFYAKKYNLTPPHSEVIEALQTITHHKGDNVLDLGCGRGRNSLFLEQLGFEVKAWDHNVESIDFLNRIIEQEGLQRVSTAVYDINQAAISEKFSWIISTVVMMFLDRERIPAIIENMQNSTKIGGYNLIVCAMDTADCPCPMPFSFTFKEGELAHYYRDWEIVKYNEDFGHLHKTDAAGNRIRLRFATMLAKKVGG